ncbi:hypothetical protein GGS21DRAFT_378482 [Xylaria nigripes]|nr:hypothetical protein GGS21DRAFT_378482 [Xylaria nigripes]
MYLTTCSRENLSLNCSSLFLQYMMIRSQCLFLRTFLALALAGWRPSPASQWHCFALFNLFHKAMFVVLISKALSVIMDIFLILNNPFILKKKILSCLCRHRST